MNNQGIRETVSATVPVMSCASCVLRINALLRQQRGVSNIRIDLATKAVQFTYRPEQIPLGTIVTALDDAGYPLVSPTTEAVG